MTKDTTSKTGAKAPDYYSYTVRDDKEDSDKGFWTKIGASGRTVTAMAARSSSRRCRSTTASFYVVPKPTNRTRLAAGKMVASSRLS